MLLIKKESEERLYVRVVGSIKLKCKGRSPFPWFNMNDAGNTCF